MSKILRTSVDGPTVSIGEKHFDRLAEIEAAEKLSRLFPVVAVHTDSDGEKLISVREIAKIEQVLDAEKQQAFEEGRAAGHESGYQQGLEEGRRIVTQFSQALNDAVNQRIKLLEEARQNVLDLVVRVAKKVTFDAVTVDPEITVAMIDNVINRLVDKSRLRVKVHPDHLPVVEQQLSRFLGDRTDIKELTFEPDPRVRVGGCFIETPGGDVDARLESQFEVIEDALNHGGEET